MLAAGQLALRRRGKLQHLPKRPLANLSARDGIKLRTPRNLRKKASYKRSRPTSRPVSSQSAFVAKLDRQFGRHCDRLTEIHSRKVQEDPNGNLNFLLVFVSFLFDFWCNLA